MPGPRTTRLPDRRTAPLPAAAAAGVSSEPAPGALQQAPPWVAAALCALYALRDCSKAAAVALSRPPGQYLARGAQFATSLAFVVLYVWGTYQAPEAASLRGRVDLWLCGVFAAEYLWRLAVEHRTAASRVRMVTSFWNICDVLAFLPPLLEVLLQRHTSTFSLGLLDLRWTKILRAMRVMRLGLLGSELRSLHLTTQRGGWLSAGANYRLFQLAASVFILLFTTSSIIQIVERIPFHQALYFVIITLTTVGYGDVVAQSALGKAVVVAMICVGVVLIPVQATAFYAELQARRVVRGTLPDWRAPCVVLSTRLTEVRAFSDFFSEFKGALAASHLPASTKLVVLCNRPSYEFSAFQELHERRVTLLEGSAVSGSDLVAARAEKAEALLLLADRFTTDPEQEDLGVLFQVWACKAYTKTVPLYVQTVREAAVRQIEPFLDPGQDVIVSMEQIRYRLLALSAVCPGASTLIGNLLKSSSIRPLEASQPTLAGRRWMRAYVNGCSPQLVEAAAPLVLVGLPFQRVAQWLYWGSGFVLLGVIEGDRVRLNPGRRRLDPGCTLLVMGSGQHEVQEALLAPWAAMSERCRRRLLLSLEGWDDQGGPDGDAEGAAAATTTEEDECYAQQGGNPESESVDLDQCEVDWGEPPGPRPTPSSTSSNANARSSDGASTSSEGMQAFVRLFRAGPAAQGEQAQQQAQQQQPGSLGPVPPAGLEQGALASLDRFSLDGGSVDGASLGAGSLETQRWAPQDGASEPAVGDNRSSSSISASSSASGSSSFSTGRSSGASGKGSWKEEGLCEGHFILCGSEESLLPFLRYLRQCSPPCVPVVLLHPHRPAGLEQAALELGPLEYVQGSSSDAAALRAAGASSARALVYLASSARPVDAKSAQATGGGSAEQRSQREAVLADAEALLAVYGVGEQSGKALTHAVVELLYTTSVEFLQPGLLLKGVSLIYDEGSAPRGTPRKSWAMRAWQQAEAVAEGLAEWQANPYYVAGRVTVPALMDTFTCQCFFNRGLLTDLLAELSGGTGAGGALLRLLPLPRGLVGATYGELFEAVALGRGALCLGLYRRKSENPATRLSYVVTNPPWSEVLEASDRVYVLRERTASAGGGE